MVCAATSSNHGLQSRHFTKSQGDGHKQKYAAPILLGLLIAIGRILRWVYRGKANAHRLAESACRTDGNSGLYANALECQRPPVRVAWAHVRGSCVDGDLRTR